MYRGPDLKETLFCYLLYFKVLFIRQSPVCKCVETLTFYISKVYMYYNDFAHVKKDFFFQFYYHLKPAWMFYRARI